MSRRILPLLASCLLALPALPQSLYVVDDDGGPGIDFTDLPPAVAGTASGDVLLVRAGTYSPFAIDGTSLSVTAEEGAVVRVAGPASIANTAAPDRVVLHGLLFEGSAPQPAIRNNLGWIGIEDCDFEAGTVSAADGAEALRIETSTVALSRCTIDGGQLTADHGIDFGAGLRVANATVHLHSSIVRGAAGAEGVRGGTGVELDGGVLLLGGCDVRGGAGGNGPAGAACADGAPGGDALVLVGAAPLAYPQATAFFAGAGGQPSAPPCTAGADGAATVVGAGTLLPLGGAAHTLAVETGEEMGQLATNAMTGVAGELAVLVLGLTPDALLFPPWLGTLLVGAPFLAQLVGVVPASGVLTFELLTPTIPGFEVLQFYEQGAFVDPFSGAIALSSPSFPVLLQAGLAP